jgi:phosphoribosyl 1,2-cyclic phosphodiesterase
VAPLKLTFLGTRGGIIIRSSRHYRHSSLLVEHGHARLMLDCGLDWLGHIDAVRPTAIVLTHAHPDHAGGLAEGAPCPVYATRETLRLLERMPIPARCELPLNRPVALDRLSLTAFPVEHSLRAPTVGLRLCAGRTCLAYVPDVADIPDRQLMLRKVLVYIGDGATLVRPLVRRKDGALTGHATVEAQLAWCREARVRQAIFTHCGSPFVRSEPAEVDGLVSELGRKYGLDASVAFDGLELSITKRRIVRASAPAHPSGRRRP